MQHSQNDVAFLLRIKSANRISEWERGKKMPSSLNLMKLSIIYRTLSDEMYSDLIQALRQDILLREKMLHRMKASSLKK